MKAVVYKGPHDVQVEQVPDPKIEAPTDAILRLTSAAICGSDLHMYEGRSSATPGMVFGHENMGVIEETGPAVTSIKKGDRVVLPFNIACGFCYNCVRGFTSACLTVNPQGVAGGYGYADMGPFRGGQAEFVRVPFADFNCLSNYLRTTSDAVDSGGRVDTRGGAAWDGPGRSDPTGTR